MKYKYYIVYKTTMEFKSNKYYYIGMHSTNDLNDGYYGSGTNLKAMMSFKETKNVKRKILAYAEDKRQLLALEGFYINKKNITDKLCLNISSGLSKEKQAKLRNDNSRILELEKEIESIRIKNTNNVEISEYSKVLRSMEHYQKYAFDYKKEIEILKNDLEKRDKVLQAYVNYKCDSIVDLKNQLKLKDKIINGLKNKSEKLECNNIMLNYSLRKEFADILE